MYRIIEIDMKRGCPLARIDKYDMTEGVEWRQILLFSLPIMAGNLLQQLYNTVDGIVVGNFVSQNALAACGTAGTLALIFLAFAIGFGNGSGIMIAQLFGAKRYEELRSAVSTALILLVGMGAVLSVLGCLGARVLLHGLLNVESGEVLELAAAYFSIYAVGLVLQFLYNAVAAILRAIGDSKATLYFLLVSSVMNLVLDLAFVIWFRWGVAGVAIATVLSQLCSAIVSVGYMFKKYPMFRFGKGEFVFKRDKCVLCLRLGVPTTIQQSIVSFGNVFIQRLINSFGEITMAAFTVGVRIENYLFVPAVGFNTGMATFTAQNIGARRIDRVRRGVRATICMTLIVAVTLELVSYFCATPISVLFGVADEALVQSVAYVRFLSFFFWIFAVYMVFAGALQGSGDVGFATVCSLSALSVRVALAYILVYAFAMDYAAIWTAMPVGWGVAMILGIIRYHTGGWKRKGIVKHG